jgi:transposase, IS5 family
MAKALKSRASKLEYHGQNQLKLPGFETPFEQNLDPKNRWVIMADNIPWDKLVSVYDIKLRRSNYGASKINSRIVIGSLIIKHMNNLSDEDVICNIQENIYMQYFVGLSSFCKERLFDPSLFVEFRKRLGIAEMKIINEIVVKNWGNKEVTQEEEKEEDEIIKDDQDPPKDDNFDKNSGSLIIDATACPQDIAYPTDLNLLSECREKLEKMIDRVHHQTKQEGIKKPRTHRLIARKHYLKVAQNRNPSKKVVRRGIKLQLNYVKRDLKILNEYFDKQGYISLTAQEYKYFIRINHLYSQQQEMYTKKTHSIGDRLVSLNQPHVRPIVRGKRTAKVEFGAKIQVGLSNGLAYLDYFSWDAFNEGTQLQHSVEEYKRRNGHYPKEVLVDKIYCTRQNRGWLKTKGILLKAKPLGRRPALSNQVSPGERNPIEGKFGQAKSSYGLNRIKARLATTSASWIACIILVLNLVKLAGESAYCLLLSISNITICQINEKFFITHFQNVKTA